MPHAFAGLALDGDERVREQVVARPMSAEHVARRAGERQIRVAELLVDADERPEVRVPGTCHELSFHVSTPNSPARGTT